jgi:hypothetical protein
MMMNEMCALEGYYAVNEITTVRPPNISEERRSHLHDAGSLKSREV